MDTMEINCFVCVGQTTNKFNNFTHLKSSYSKSTISNVIKRILNDFDSSRNIDDESNCICFECLKKIINYDKLHKATLDQQNALKTLIISTEEKLHEMKNHTEFKREFEECNDETVLVCEFFEEETETESDRNDILITDIEESTQNQSSKSVTPLNTEMVPKLANSLTSSEKKRSKDSATSSAMASEFNTPKKCKLCDDIFHNKKTYSDHLKHHARRSKRICGICNSSFKKLATFEKHMEWHDIHPGFSCRICYLQLDDKTSLSQHMEQHKERGSNTICVICDKKYSHVGTVRMHMDTHGEPKILCDLCGRKFFTMEILSIHRKVHFDERSFKCPHCPKAFKWKKVLENHVPTHVTNRDRPFACTFCDMRFLRVDHCRVHERRHKENTKIETCSFCSAAFEHKIHLKQHIKRKHGAETLTGNSNSLAT